MTTEDYVSFETAKLLKEKGFDGENRDWYNTEGFIEEIGVDDGIDSTAHEDIFNDVIPAPTLQMAMKWLREKHDQNVTVKAHNNIARRKTIYYAEVQNLSEPAEKGFCVNGCIFKDTYEEAVEYTIKYCLENLI